MLRGRTPTAPAAAEEPSARSPQPSGGKETRLLPPATAQGQRLREKGARPHPTPGCQRCRAGPGRPRGVGGGWGGGWGWPPAAAAAAPGLTCGGRGRPEGLALLQGDGAVPPDAEVGGRPQPGGGGLAATGAGPQRAAALVAHGPRLLLVDGLVVEPEDLLQRERLRLPAAAAVLLLGGGGAGGAGLGLRAALPRQRHALPPPRCSSDHWAAPPRRRLLLLLTLLLLLLPPPGPAALILPAPLVPPGRRTTRPGQQAGRREERRPGRPPLPPPRGETPHSNAMASSPAPAANGRRPAPQRPLPPPAPAGRHWRRRDSVGRSVRPPSRSAGVSVREARQAGQAAVFLPHRPGRAAALLRRVSVTPPPLPPRGKPLRSASRAPAFPHRGHGGTGPQLCAARTPRVPEQSAIPAVPWLRGPPFRGKRPAPRSFPRQRSRGLRRPPPRLRGKAEGGWRSYRLERAKKGLICPAAGSWLSRLSAPPGPRRAQPLPRPGTGQGARRTGESAAWGRGEVP